MLLFMEGLDCH